MGVGLLSCSLGASALEAEQQRTFRDCALCGALRASPVLTPCHALNCIPPNFIRCIWRWGLWEVIRFRWGRGNVLPRRDPRELASSVCLHAYAWTEGHLRSQQGGPLYPKEGALADANLQT